MRPGKDAGAGAAPELAIPTGRGTATGCAARRPVRCKRGAPVVPGERSVEMPPSSPAENPPRPAPEPRRRRAGVRVGFAAPCAAQGAPRRRHRPRSAPPAGSSSATCSRPARARPGSCWRGRRRGRGRRARTATWPSSSATGRSLRLPADAVLPYDDLSPDRGVEMERLAALARLHLVARGGAGGGGLGPRAVPPGGAAPGLRGRLGPAGQGRRDPAGDAGRAAGGAGLLPDAAGRGPRHLRGPGRHRRPVEPGRRRSRSGSSSSATRSRAAGPSIPANQRSGGRRGRGAALPGPRGPLHRGGRRRPRRRCARPPSGSTAPPAQVREVLEAIDGERALLRAWRRSCPASTRAGW